MNTITTTTEISTLTVGQKVTDALGNVWTIRAEKSGEKKVVLDGMRRRLSLDSVALPATLS